MRGSSAGLWVYNAPKKEGRGDREEKGVEAAAAMQCNVGESPEV